MSEPEKTNTPADELLLATEQYIALLNCYKKGRCYWSHAVLALWEPLLATATLQLAQAKVRIAERAP